MQPDWDNILGAAGLLFLIVFGRRILRFAEGLNPMLAVSRHAPSQDLAQLTMVAALVLLVLLVLKCLRRP